MSLLRGEIVKSEKEIREEIISLRKIGLSMLDSQNSEGSVNKIRLKQRFVDCVNQDIAKLEWVLGDD